MATNVHLTPELERFARKCVEGGRYNNVSEVVRSGLRLLQEAEDQPRLLRVAAVVGRFDAKGTVIAVQQRRQRLDEGKARPPHQRAITEDPEAPALRWLQRARRV